LIKVGNPQLAVDEINQTLARTPDDVRALGVRVWAYTKVGNDEAALRDIETILAKGPDAAAYQFRSEIRARRGDKAGALADIRQTVALAPENLNARVDEIRLLDDNGQKAAADERHRALLILKPDIRSDYLTKRNPNMAQELKAEQDAENRRAAAQAQQNRIGTFLEGMVSAHTRALDLFRDASEASDGYDALDDLRDSESILARAVDEAETFRNSADGGAMDSEDRASFERNLDLLREAHDIVMKQRQRLEITAYGETSEDYDPDAYDSY
jgi:tetratricopeptide (TPR) repeat protein